MHLSALAGISLTSAALLLGMCMGGQVERFVDSPFSWWHSRCRTF